MENLLCTYKTLDSCSQKQIKTKTDQRDEIGVEFYSVQAGLIDYTYLINFLGRFIDIYE